MSQEVIVHGHVSLLSHQESGKEKVSRNSSPESINLVMAMSQLLQRHFSIINYSGAISAIAQMVACDPNVSLL
jgi:hypothetical protein